MWGQFESKRLYTYSSTNGACMHVFQTADRDITICTIYQIYPNLPFWGAVLDLCKYRSIPDEGREGSGDREGMSLGIVHQNACVYSKRGTCLVGGNQPAYLFNTHTVRVASCADSRQTHTLANGSRLSFRPSVADACICYSMLLLLLLLLLALLFCKVPLPTAVHSVPGK